MNIKAFVYFILLSTFVQVSAEENSNKISRFIKNIQTFNTVLPQEKVYLHFDNTSYFIGEHIWFKAYVVNSAENKPTQMSRILYVELLNQQGYVLQTKKLKIDERGQCNGDFRLNDSLFSGFYEIRAYTRHMLSFDNTGRWKLNSNNVGSNFASGLLEWMPYGQIQKRRNVVSHSIHYYYECNTLFSRVFPVYEKFNSLDDFLSPKMKPRIWNPDYTLNIHENYLKDFPNLVTEIPEKKILEIALFPEGGHLIKGIPTTVAVKINDGDGKNEMVNGIVKNENGEAIAHFKTSKSGTASFRLIPTETGQKYFAEVAYMDSVYKCHLPDVEENGYGLHVVNKEGDKFLKLEFQKSEKTDIEPLGYTIMCRGQVVCFDTIRISEKEPCIIRILKDSLPNGVKQITLFNSAGQIFSERLFFTVNSMSEGINFRSTCDKSILKPLDSLNIEFQVTNNMGTPKELDFSVSVRDASTLEKTYYSDNIKTNLLLSSELKGYIYNPAYYFEKNDSIHATDLDLLMLTQGWRRYDWKKMSGNDRFFMTEPIEKCLTLDGFVLNNNTIVTGDIDILLHLGYTDTLLLIGETKMDKNGSFRFDMADFYGKHYASFDFYQDGKRVFSEGNYEKRDVFSYGLQGVLNRFSVLPKPSFSYYETEKPINDRTGGNNITNMRNEVSLPNVMVKGTKKKRNSRYPDFDKPDILLTGQEAVEKVMDHGFMGLRGIHKSGLLFDSLNVSIANMPEYEFQYFINFLTHSVYRLITDPKDFYVQKRNQLFYGPIERLIQGEYDDQMVDELSRQALRSIKIKDIESIGIYMQQTPRIPYTHAFPSGYVLIKMNPSSTRILLDNFRRTHVEGFSNVAEFYHPTYKSGALPTNIKDVRRTLYWNPDVRTDSTGKATIRFFNNSTCNKLDISAEGITRSGIPLVLNK